MLLWHDTIIKSMARKKSQTTQEFSYTVLYEPVRPCGFQVTAPLLPGLITYGRTFDEARVMARDAVRCYLEALKKDRERIPSERSLLQERLTVAL